MRERILVDLIGPSYDAIEPIAVGDVAAVVQEIRCADRSNLLDRHWLATWLLPRLGLNDEWAHEFPESLQRFCGTGIKSWQFPAQFAGYLVYLASKNITNYLEIGVRHGGTFIITCEYLDRFTPLQSMLAADPFQSSTLADYLALQPKAMHVADFSHSHVGRSAIASRFWDHALIDGDHSFDGCMTDFLLLKDRAKRVAFHDIVSDTNPGVVQVWETIRSVTPARRIFEQTQQYTEVAARSGQNLMGLGVVELT